MLGVLVLVHRFARPCAAVSGAAIARRGPSVGPSRPIALEGCRETQPSGNDTAAGRLNRDRSGDGRDRAAVPVVAHLAAVANPPQIAGFVCCYLIPTVLAHIPIIGSVPVAPHVRGLVAT